MSKKFFPKLPVSTSFRNLFSSKSDSNADKTTFHESKSTEHIDLNKEIVRTFSVPSAQHLDTSPIKPSRSEALNDHDFVSSPRRLDIRCGKKEQAEEYGGSGYSSCSRTPTHTSKTPVYNVRYEEEMECSSSSRTPLHTPKTPTGFIRYEEGGNNSYSSGVRTPPKASKKMSFMSQFTKDGAGAVGKDNFVKGDVLIKGVAPECAGLIGAFSAGGDIFASDEQIEFNDKDLDF